MPKWTLDVDYEFPTYTQCTALVTTFSAQTQWKNLAVVRHVTAGKTIHFAVDSDWEYANLSDALAKITALSAIAGFTAATVKYATGEPLE